MTSRWNRITGAIGALLLVCLAAGPSIPSAEGQNKANKKLPRTILLIRHAEKPPEELGSVHLTAEGAKRARALSELFKPADKRAEPFPTPHFVFAAKDSKKSHRSVETVTPLAQAFKLAINSSYADAEFAKLAYELLENPTYAGKTILVCWHHGTAAQFARSLKSTDAPASWKGSAFDRVWQFDYDKNGNATFRDRPQQLLPQDSDR